ncbi:MAG: phage terminase large subunit, partial [Candidatus Andersenbacteria bacterium]
LHYYETLPSMSTYNYRYTGIGIDLAISQKQTADYTAMVAGMVFDRQQAMRLYILPNPVNERLTFPQQLDRAKAMHTTLHGAKLFIEDVGYQTALIQQLNRDGFQAEGVPVHGQDKRARLALVTSHIQNGQVLFPKVGAENLIRQLTGFGTETHDDLADAFAILTYKTIEKNRKLARVFKEKPAGW